MQRGIAAWVVFPAFSIIFILIAAISLPTTIGAAQGHGTRGSFTAVQHITSRSSHWTGTFTPADHGPIIQDVTTDDISGLQPGSVVPALYNGGQVFSAHGSKAWLANLGIVIVGALVLVRWCWSVPFRYLRQRGSVAAPPWARGA